MDHNSFSSQRDMFPSLGNYENDDRHPYREDLDDNADAGSESASYFGEAYAAAADARAAGGSYEPPLSEQVYNLRNECKELEEQNIYLNNELAKSQEQVAELQAQLKDERERNKQRRQRYRENLDTLDKLYDADKESAKNLQRLYDACKERAARVEKTNARLRNEQRIATHSVSTLEAELGAARTHNAVLEAELGAAADHSTVLEAELRAAQEHISTQLRLVNLLVPLVSGKAVSLVLQYPVGISLEAVIRAFQDYNAIGQGLDLDMKLYELSERVARDEPIEQTYGHSPSQAPHYVLTTVYSALSEVYQDVNEPPGIGVCKFLRNAQAGEPSIVTRQQITKPRPFHTPTDAAAAAAAAPRRPWRPSRLGQQSAMFQQQEEVLRVDPVQQFDSDDADTVINENPDDGGAMDVQRVLREDPVQQFDSDDADTVINENPDDGGAMDVQRDDNGGAMDARGAPGRFFL